MVKGISRQVIVVHSPDKKLFEQAIFILKEDALSPNGVTDEMLLKEANRLIRGPLRRKKTNLLYYGPIWALAGAVLTASVWIVTALL